jgi:anti-sigma factor RsiW
MNAMTSEPAEMNHVDGLLREYFRSEMPQRLPALKLPAPAMPKRSRRALVSRFALAASVLFLVLGFGFASELLPRTTDTATPAVQLPQNGNAMIRDSQGNPVVKKPTTRLPQPPRR